MDEHRDEPELPPTNDADDLGPSPRKRSEGTWLGFINARAGDVLRQFNTETIAPLIPMYGDAFKRVLDSGIQERLAEISSVILPEGWDTGLKAILETSLERVLPRNLHGIRPLRFDAVRQLADEGITLHMVPRTTIARRLLSATTTKARRRILGDCAAAILDDCAAVLDECTDPATMTGVSFTRKAIAAARDGHTEAAQALAANTLDTLLVDTYGWRGSRQVTSHKPGNREELRNSEVRYFMVMAPIHQVYADFWTDRGDPVPSAFSRHASAHAVGPRQFTRRATIQAIMLTTSFIAWRNDL